MRRRGTEEALCLFIEEHGGHDTATENSMQVYWKIFK